MKGFIINQRKIKGCVVSSGHHERLINMLIDSHSMILDLIIMLSKADFIADETIEESMDSYEQSVVFRSELQEFLLRQKFVIKSK